MGKWASQSKRGGSGMTGYISPPQLADWSMGAPTIPTTTLTRIAAIPLGATSMVWLTVRESDGVVISQTSSAGPIASGISYRVYPSWFNGNVRVSDWGPYRTLVGP